jgi:hypothetical protein
MGSSDLVSKFWVRNTRNGTRVVTKDVVDYQAVKSNFDKNSLSYHTFFPKSEKPIKALLRYLPSNTPSQDISDGLVDLGFDVVGRGIVVRYPSHINNSTSLI